MCKHHPRCVASNRQMQACRLSAHPKVNLRVTSPHNFMPTIYVMQQQLCRYLHCIAVIHSSSLAWTSRSCMSTRAATSASLSNSKLDRLNEYYKLHEPDQLRKVSDSLDQKLHVASNCSSSREGRHTDSCTLCTCRDESVRKAAHAGVSASSVHMASRLSRRCCRSNSMQQVHCFLQPNPTIQRLDAIRAPSSTEAVRRPLPAFATLHQQAASLLQPEAR